MSKRIYVALIAILLFAFEQSFAQDAIQLNNPSFEDMARPGIPPRGWFDCGRINFPNETPPDVHPEQNNPTFEVSKKAADGDTYLGMVVRENDSWESVAQRLTSPMYPDQCYSFSIHLSRSAIYKSPIRGSDVKINFTKPLKLRIWGGTGYCEKRELLAESDLVKNTDWKQFDFKFEPKQRTTYIILEAFFKTPVLSPPNGNLLLDNASSIEPIPCKENPPVKPVVEITNPSQNRKKVTKSTFKLLAEVLNIKRSKKIIVKVNGENNRDFSFNPTTHKLEVNLKLREGENNVSIRAANAAGNSRDAATIVYNPPTPDPVVIADPPAKPKKTEMEKILDNLGEGEKIKVDKLFFDINSYVINDKSQPVLDEIFGFMQKNTLVKVEIGGHTNRNCQTDYCNELSTNRAKAVVDYLIKKGIPSDRLTFKGYGKTKPVTFAKNREAQKKNQRVEIKITSKKG